MTTAEQFAEWKEHPVTKEIYQGIKKTKQELVNRIAEGQTLGHASDVTHGLTNRMVGHIEGLNQLLNISYADKQIEKEVNEVSGY
jgi:uncharacterized phage-associated protein